MKRLITLSSPLGGYFCGVESTCVGINLPDFVTDMMANIAYSDFIQHILGPASYWRDPYQLDNYEENCKILPELDNIRDYDE